MACRVIAGCLAWPNLSVSHPRVRPEPALLIPLARPKVGYLQLFWRRRRTDSAHIMGEATGDKEDTETNELAPDPGS